MVRLAVLIIFCATLVGALMPSFEAPTSAPPPAAGQRVIQADDLQEQGSFEPTASSGTVTLERSFDGHFYADAQVNGTTIRFLVDTGASMVVLTREDAQRAGIQLPSARAMAMGVGGPIEVIPVTLDRIAVGGIEARGVEAAIADETPVSLLGQSYLQRVGSVEIRGDTMVLR